MASKQCEKKAPQLSAAQQADLDKIVEQAKQSYVCEDIAKKAREIVAKNEGHEKDQKLVSLLAGTFTNSAKDILTLLDSKHWDGTIVVDFPKTFSLAGPFSMAGLFSGIKAGAAYVGKNQAGKECVWLVAFADNSALGRVMYAECGPLRNYTNINWEAIKAKLNDASFIAYASDAETGTSIYGTIVGQDPGTVAAAAFTG
ncbi:jasmonate-induced protein homolog [Beta vulgaris subsp. vulgaris]|uniref:jasmonate-induced protein homolog n=1 Tax=Beta vulgaris subsp. vulgaris TaxID=3555 RepID=UPI002036D03A|nr:jasmonate-induced protein homolog [Beta vulgaris subsp. vulgaris]XP_010686335.2 jasmonate-induced protein homolog [Beta vulgaris subsp. vulgaris]XP_010686336.2 jasmonate-induced protein homolog [Beta vulgaris subsp. vulgaris]XP_010686338.2 jasmonate-induced protein homolog [Beta vulgaris subsp. vulgaris]